MISQHSAIALAVRDGLSTQLDIETLQITLDINWSPYVQATLTVKSDNAVDGAITYSDTLYKTDPYYNTRIQLYVQESFGASETLGYLTSLYSGQTLANLTTAWSGQTLGQLTALWHTPWNGTVIDNVRRFFNLKVRSARFNEQDQTVQLALESDESLLGDYALIDTEPYSPNKLTAATAVSYTLSLIGAYLQAGYSDAAIEADASVWEPGDNAWDYIQSICDAANLRLYCNEARQWYLTDSYTTGDSRSIAYGSDYINMSQDVSLDGDFYSAAVVKYSWTNDLGVQKVAYDTYYNSIYNYVKVKRVEYNRRYPGPGGARAIVMRKNSKTITRTTTMVNDYNYTPGDTLTIATQYMYPPISTSSAGAVASVTWSLPADRMTVTSKHTHMPGGRPTTADKEKYIGITNQAMGA